MRKTYGLLKSGMYKNPGWFEALKDAPIEMGGVICIPPDLHFPEDELWMRLLHERMPFLQLEGEPLFGTTLAHRIARKQWDFMEKGLSEDDAFAQAEKAFKPQIDALMKELKKSHHGRPFNCENIDKVLKDRIDEAMQKRAVRRRKGAVPLKPTHSMQIEKNINLAKGFPMRYSWAYSDDVFLRADRVDSIMDGLRSSGLWRELFPNPFHLDPESKSPVVQALTKWLNKIKFDPPQPEVIDRVTKLWKKLTDPRSIFNSGLVRINEGISLSDLLAFIEEPVIQAKSVTEAEQNESNEKLPIVLIGRVYTPEEVEQRQKRVAELKLIYDQPLPSRSKYESMRIDGFHDLVRPYVPGEDLGYGDKRARLEHVWFKVGHYPDKKRW